MKTSNYETLTNAAKNKLRDIITDLYSSHGIIDITVTKNGTVRLIKQNLLFGLISIGETIPIFQLLFDEIPKAMSYQLWNSGDFAKQTRNLISEVVTENEIYPEAIKASKIIDTLYTILYTTTAKEKIVSKIVTDFINNSPKRLSKAIIVEEIEPTTERIVSEVEVEDSEEDGRLFLLFRELFQNKLSKGRKLLYLSSLFLALNAFKLIGLLPIGEEKARENSYTEILLSPSKRSILDTS